MTNLETGQKTDFDGIRNLEVRLDWNTTNKNQAIECDLMAFVIHQEGIIKERWDVIFYNQPLQGSGSFLAGCVKHTGNGTPGSEQLYIKLDEMPDRYIKIVLLFSIYDAKANNLNLGMLDDVTLTFYDADKKNLLHTIHLTNMKDDMASVTFGEFFRADGGWVFDTQVRQNEENNVVILSTEYGIRKDWRYIKI